ncbi:MAG: DoxX family protein [Candidatus Woesearchaeota archaeon]
MRSDSVQTEVFGKEVSFPYAHQAVGYSLVLMRVAIGWILLAGGLDKLFSSSWSASGYLLHAIHPANPFVSVFASLAGSVLVDWLVIIGLTATGLGLILGLFTRLCALFAAILMFLFYLAALQGGLLAFLPLEHGFVVNEHIVYVMLLFGISSFGAGQVLGLDAWLRKTRFVVKRPWLMYVLG